MDFDAIKLNRPSVARMNAGQDFDQCAFARAIFTHERVDFPLSNREVHFFERSNAREGFRQLADLEQRGGFVAHALGWGATKSIFALGQLRRRLRFLEHAFLNDGSLGQFLLGHDRIDGVK